MKQSKEFITSYLKEKFNVTDNDIDNLVLSMYMDSLDLLEMVVAIESHYNINIPDDDMFEWLDNQVIDIAAYVDKKIN
jgi:acyl carrier protein